MSLEIKQAIKQAMLGIHGAGTETLTRVQKQITDALEVLVRNEQMQMRTIKIENEQSKHHKP